MTKKKQTRRTVSLRPATYDALRLFCEAREIAMSALVTGLIDEGLKDLYEEEKRVERELRAMADRDARQLTLLGDHPPGVCPCGQCKRGN